MLSEGKTSMLHFVYNSRVVCVLVSHSVKEGEFVLQVPFYPPVETIDDYRLNPSRCLKIITDACFEKLPEKFEAEIVDINSWRMEAVVAERYMSKDGDYSRVVLAGDSAHAFPPSGGFGLNAGIGDAFNLAHKISSSLEPQGFPLEAARTYSNERRMIGMLTSDFSLQNYNTSL